MSRNMGERAQESGMLYRVVVEQGHPEWGDSTSVYGPYATRGAAAGQKTRLDAPRWGDWTKEVHLESTSVDWQREEED